MFFHFLGVIFQKFILSDFFKKVAWLEDQLVNELHFKESQLANVMSSLLIYSINLKVSSCNKVLRGPFGVLAIDWVIFKPSSVPLSDKFSLLSAKSQMSLFQHTHTCTHGLLCFPSSFPIDVPQWHWCCTSSCLTSEFSRLSRGLNILSEVFLAPMPENAGLFAYNRQFQLHLLLVT